jgi:ATP-binding cassette subfamily C protein CydC
MGDLKPYFQLYKKHWFHLTIGSLIGLLTLLASVGLLTVSGWFLSASAVAGLTIARQTFNYMLPGAAVRGLAISRTAGRWGERVITHDATFKLLTDLRVRFFKRMIPLFPRKNATLRDADLLNRITADVEAMDHIYLRLVSPIAQSFIGIVLLSLIVAWFDTASGLWLGATLVAVLVIWPPLFYKLGKHNGEQLTLTKATLRTTLIDYISAHSELLIYGGENKRYKQFIQQQSKLIEHQFYHARISALASSLLMLVNGVTLLGILYLGLNGYHGEPATPITALIVFAALSSMELLIPIAGAFQFLGQTLTSAKRLNQITEASPEVTFSDDSAQAQPLSSQSLDVQIDNVSFQYSERPVLQQIDLTLPAGSKTALLGKTGCGKSTLAQLLTRSWDCDSGAIYFNGVALRQIPEDVLRASISVVSQRVDILNDSLRNNLTIANNKANDEQLADALHKVELSHLLDDTGLEQWLGDGGRQLSGGEKRRIGLARMLLHTGKLVILDEATEGLDKTTEKKMLDLITEHCKNKTALFITHRLSNLHTMDNIVMMESGRIVEQGDFSYLLKQNGRFKRLTEAL